MLYYVIYRVLLFPDRELLESKPPLVCSVSRTKTPNNKEKTFAKLVKKECKVCTVKISEEIFNLIYHVQIKF